MNDPMPLPDDLKAFASQLGLFAAQSKMDRDAVMFAAGQDSRELIPAASCRDQRGVRCWQAATAAMALLSVSLGSLIVLRPAPEPRVMIVERDLPLTSEASVPGPTETREQQHEATTVEADFTGELDGGGDRQSGDELASAWKARQALIADSGKIDFRSDDAAAANRRASWNGDSRFVVDQPLTGASLLPGRSRDAVSRSLEERL